MLFVIISEDCRKNDYYIYNSSNLEPFLYQFLNEYVKYV